MHPLVFAQFDAICRAKLSGDSVLEVGATDKPDSLLNLPALAAVRQRVGINLDGPLRGRGYTVMRGNANQMVDFADDRFDAVLCNATLEHDPFFWRTLDEIRRVVRPGGLVVLGVPGYAQLPGEWLARKLAALFDVATTRPAWFGVRGATITLGIHNYPGDYYRFSEQAMREVLLAGLEHTSLRRILVPPRLIGWGTKPLLASQRLRGAGAPRT